MSSAANAGTASTTATCTWRNEKGTTHMTTRYITCAETAKLLRGALKRAFPGVKFSVKSKTYSMGASITVRWIDGPTAQMVEAVTGPYAGAGFDGMIDLKYHSDAWLAPDGTVTFAKTHGTQGSMGTVPSAQDMKPSHKAELVSFGADYVFCTRSYSEGFYRRALETACRKWGQNP